MLRRPIPTAEESFNSLLVVIRKMFSESEIVDGVVAEFHCIMGYSRPVCLHCGECQGADRVRDQIRERANQLVKEDIEFMQQWYDAMFNS